MYEPLTECRLCGWGLELLLDLGVQKMTGIFPKTIEEDEALEAGPLRLVRCRHEDCRLVQLDGTYDLDQMYGMNYGYRSGLNAGMV